MHKSSIIRVAKYNECLSNIVFDRKKNGKMRVCVDYKDLNNATPKDVYPMMVVDMLIDALARHEMLITKFQSRKKIGTKQPSGALVLQVHLSMLLCLLA